jgi:hypothetical protein
MTIAPGSGSLMRVTTGYGSVFGQTSELSKSQIGTTGKR